MKAKGQPFPIEELPDDARSIRSKGHSWLDDLDLEPGQVVEVELDGQRAYNMAGGARNQAIKRGLVVLIRQGRLFVSRPRVEEAQR